MNAEMFLLFLALIIFGVFCIYANRKLNPGITKLMTFVGLWMSVASAIYLIVRQMFIVFGV